MSALAVLSVGALVTGCGERIKRPSSSDFTLSGQISRLTNGGGEALGGATVTASIDQNKNGTIEDSEKVEATADDAGKYSLAMKVNAGDRVVVRFAADGVAPVLKSFNAGPWAEMPLNAAMRELESFSCDADQQQCALDGNKLTLHGLADDTSGSARVFNPESETNAFPGAFDDSQGNLLISGVFGAVDLQDGSGNPVSTLDQPADLRMRVPEETWKVIVDLQPGDDRIQIPLYSFREASGEWVRDGEGFLETSSGAVIPESRLAEIRAGTFDEGVTACGKVSHFSYWNVDWPVNTKQCLTGVVVGDDGKPAEGATVFISGITYTGISKPSTVGADGKFCAEVMRSENAGEDVDNDGVTGETQQVRIRIAYGGKLYDGGVYDTKKEAATCGSGGCLDVGDLTLSTDKQVSPKICTIHGKVTDNTGATREGAQVVFADPSVPEEIREDLCGFAGLNCTLFAMSEADGSYEAKFPVLDGASLFALFTEADGSAQVNRFRVGTASTEGCPDREVPLKMNDGYDQVNLTVTVSGGQISWTPAEPATVLEVDDSNGDFKWELSAASKDGFAGPVTYGAVPGNAIQGWPENNAAPPALSSGDTVRVVISRESEHIPVVGTGEAQVP